MDDDRNAEESRGKRGRHASVPALRYDHVRKEAEQGQEGGHKAGTGHYRVGDIEKRTIPTHLSRRRPDKNNVVFKKRLLIKWRGREVVEARRKKSPLAHDVVHRFRNGNNGVEMPPRSPARK